MKKLLCSSLFKTSSSIVLVALALTLGFGCGKQYDSPSSPIADEATEFSVANPKIQAVMAVQERHTSQLMSNSEVVGTAVGLTEDGQPAILILAKSEISTQPLQKVTAANAVPESIEGIPVLVEVTGVIRPFANHKTKQTPPISLGTSGGWKYDLANGYCCSGTLGALVAKGGKNYILSNYHVFMGDMASGGNSRIAVAGDPVTQPGMVDISCNVANSQDVATLEGTRSLPSSNVDAALAQIITGMVKTNGDILDVGTISKSTVAASLNQKVKKSGRTTGLTRSTISGLNASVSVAYETECAGSTAFTKTFTGQIIIKNSGSKFLAGGDSGSLMVEDKTSNARAVGLLFAGSTSTAVANPIGQVLSFFGATMVGN
jgi:hypothetical protein